jgi:hypothetical protein
MTITSPVIYISEFDRDNGSTDWRMYIRYSQSEDRFILHGTRRGKTVVSRKLPDHHMEFDTTHSLVHFLINACCSTSRMEVAGYMMDYANLPDSEVTSYDELRVLQNEMFAYNDYLWFNESSLTDLFEMLRSMNSRY